LQILYHFANIISFCKYYIILQILYHIELREKSLNLNYLFLYYNNNTKVLLIYNNSTQVLLIKIKYYQTKLACVRMVSLHTDNRRINFSVQHTENINISLDNQPIY